MNSSGFVVNSENTRIKKCCASCGYKMDTNDVERRKCMLSNKRVTKDFLCQNWCISEFFDELKIGYNK